MPAANASPDRWAFLRWPLDSLADRVPLLREKELFSSTALKRKYPLRALRYWWALCAIQQEAKRLGRPLAITDVGCGRGILRTFIGDAVPARWTGLDWRADEARLTPAGYQEIHSADFDKPLPLADASADVISFLHVLEHLPRPAFTLSELARVLRPGGVLLAGSPVAPRFLARRQEARLQRQLREGRRKPGKHINCFWPGRWRDLMASAGLHTEILAGAMLLRWSGSVLENSRGWVRLNQFWGALFPSLGEEIYVMARK